MSSIDQAFIKAYRDEMDDKAHDTAGRSAAAGTPIENLDDRPKKGAAAQPQRRSARTTKRSEAAAAVRSTARAAKVAPIESHSSTDSAAASSKTEVSQTMDQGKQKMVVGRRALKQLAENSVVPAPHAASAQRQVAIEIANTHEHHELHTSNHATVARRVAPIAERPETGGVHSEQEKPLRSDNSPVRQYRVDARVRPAAPDNTMAKSSRPTAEPAPAVLSVAGADESPRYQEFARHPEALRARDRDLREKDLRDKDSKDIQIDPVEFDRPQPEAALEVDGFAWPSICEVLIEHAASELESLADRIQRQAADAAQTIALVGIDEGDGVTTVLLCLAQILANREQRVCLVDGNFRRPGLADCLGLEPDRGLESALAGQAALHEVLVESIGDRLTVLPLAAPLHSEDIERSKLRQTVTLGELRDCFDIVLIDGGSIAQATTRASSMLQSGTVDAAIIVGNQTAAAEAWQRTQNVLERWNVPCCGAIVNRCAT